MQAQELKWDGSRCGPGVRLSSQRHAMRRDALRWDEGGRSAAGWAGVLGEAAMRSGRHGWSFAFSGRLSHVLVGIAAVCAALPRSRVRARGAFCTVNGRNALLRPTPACRYRLQPADGPQTHLTVRSCLTKQPLAVRSCLIKQP